MCPPGFFKINQCQIITFLIFKSGNIENSRIELKGIVLPVPSNQIKVTFRAYYYFTLQLGTFVIFFLFHIEIEGNVGGLCGLLGGGGSKGYVAPPPSNYWVLLIWISVGQGPIVLPVGAGGGPAGIWFQNDVVSTSMRRDHVASTSTQRHFGTKCPLGGCLDIFLSFLISLFFLPLSGRRPDID